MAPEAPSYANIPAPNMPAARRVWVPDVVVVFLIIVLWWFWLAPEVMQRHPVVYDTFRDAAGAENVLAGRWFCDPMTAGQTYWYAPLGSVVFAAVSRVTGQPPLTAYATSILWFNLLLPVGWYALARCCWGWRVGVAAVPLVWLGSRWWSFHVAMPMTATQGVVLLMGVLLAWVLSLRRRRRWAVVVGVLLAGCAWYHTLSGLIAAAAIGFHGLAGAGSPSADGPGRATVWRREARLRVLIVAVVCAPLVAPLAWHLLSLPVVNPAPIEYVSTLLKRPEFALQTRAWLILPLAVAGLVPVCKRLHRPGGVIVGYGLASLVGQGWGYVRVLGGVPVPVLIPHEFQWNFQIAVGLLAANGAARIAAWAAGRIERRAPGTRVSHALLMVPVVVLVLQKDAAPAFRRKSMHWRPTTLSAGRVSAVDWIKRNTSIDDVFLASAPENYLLVAARTGRKIVLAPEGHANIAVSAERRARDHRQMLQTTDPSELRALLAAHQVRYVLLAQRDLGCWDRWRSWGFFDPVFGAESRSLTILRARPEVLGPPREGGADGGAIAHPPPL